MRLRHQNLDGHTGISGEEIEMQPRDTSPPLERREPVRPERATVEQIDTDGATPGAARYRVTCGGGNTWDVDVTKDGDRYSWGLVQDALDVENYNHHGHASEHEALMAAVRHIEGKQAESDT